MPEFKKNSVVNSFRFKAVVCVLWALPLSPAQAEITVATTNLKPYSYEENGVLKGTSTAIVNAIFENTGIDYEAHVQPWPRTYDMALQGKDVLVYPIMRTPAREEKFQWIGPLGASSEIALYKLKSRTDVEVESLDDAKKYTVGVVRDTMNHQYLQSQGFEKGVNVSAVTRTQQNLNKILTGRIDLMVFMKTNFSHEMESFGLEDSQFEEVIPLFKTTPYMALSKMTSPGVYEQITKSYRALVVSGEIQEFK